MLKNFRNFERDHLIFGKILSYFWQILFVIVLIFIAENGQKEQTIYTSGHTALYPDEGGVSGENEFKNWILSPPENEKDESSRGLASKRLDGIIKATYINIIIIIVMMSTAFEPKES